jgi:truncated hemoglobin YjbI
VHLSLGLTPAHFERWVALFRTSATAVLQPEAAAYAIGKVEHMSTCFQTGLFLPPIEKPPAE